MKRAWIATTIAGLALALPAWGQIRGAPASVTSMAPGRSFAPGPPASVTSLGPHGFSHGFSTPCSGISPLIPSAVGCTPQFTTGFSFPDPRVHGRGHFKRHNFGSFFPVYVPYAYPYPVPVEAEPDAEVEPDPPAPTIFEHRATTDRVPVSASSAARYGAAYLDPRANQAPPPDTAEDSPAPASTPVREQIPVVLIYRDGHEQEITNYAIVGQTLYDLGTFVAHKIPLSDLNLKATIKANDERGVEFSVPASVKLD